MDIDAEHLADQVSQLSREVHRDLLKLTTDDVHRQEVHVHSFEWWLERTHLVEHDSKGPDVALERIGTTLNDLR